MKRAKHKIKEQLQHARKTEIKVMRILDDDAPYTSKTTSPGMPGWSDRRIAARKSKDRFTADNVPYAFKHTLEPTTHALEAQEKPKNTTATKDMTMWQNYLSKYALGGISAIDQTEYDDADYKRDKASPIVGNVLVRPETMFAIEIASFRQDIEAIRQLHAPKAVICANPIIPAYVPREHWLNCALKSLGF